MSCKTLGEDSWDVYGTTLTSRLLVGTALYPSPKILADAIRASEAEIVTVSLRRESGGSGAGTSFWSLIRELGVRVLPNTAGCHTVKEAVTTAEMAREVFDTPWVKLEVISDDDTLAPDVFGLVEAARILSRDGFQVFPYTTEDLGIARKACRCRLRNADALGRADRQRPRAQQPLWLAGDARAFSQRAARRRCRHRHAVACGGGDGTRLRRDPAQHGDRQSRATPS